MKDIPNHKNKGLTLIKVTVNGLTLADIKS